MTFDLVILDEAHSLGQFAVPSNRTKQLKKLCNGLPIVYLSGTPSPESYSQLYHQFWISSYSPFIEPTFYKWAANYVTIGIKHMYNRQIKDYSNADKAKIDERTAHLFISFTQEQAGFEQLIDEEVHTVTMKSVTYQMAKHLRTHRVIVFKDDRELTADTEVKLMQKLHQIFSGSVKHECGTSREFDTSKIEYIHNKFAGQKIAIFYKFIAEKNIITAFLQDKGVTITESPEFFNANPDSVFISQIQSGREGINLSSADCLIMYNIDFSAVSYWQARARLQTKDRTKAAKVHWIFAMDGIEPKIYGAVSKKKDYTLKYFKKDFAE
jgi:SNF2 family DNA or RNA helicase